MSDSLVKIGSGAREIHGGAVPCGQAVLEARAMSIALTGRTGRRLVLADVSMKADRGELVAIVGRSGTGKTTLLRALAGLIPAGGGEVRFEGGSIDGPPRGLGMVFQDYQHALLPWRTAAKNIALGLEGRTSRRERAERVAEVLELVGLEQYASEYPARMSGGMQQRVQIGRALAQKPSLLLMDEPFGALDALTRAALQDELLALRARTQATIVFITHDIDEAVYLGDRVLVLAGQPGTISADRPVQLPEPRDQLTTHEHPGYLSARHAVHQAVMGRAHD